jgi:hypothetical protein
MSVEPIDGWLVPLPWLDDADPYDVSLEAPHAEPPNRCPNDGAWVTPGNTCVCGRTA